MLAPSGPSCPPKPNWSPSPTGQWMIKRLAALPGDPVPADLAIVPEPLTGPVPAGCRGRYGERERLAAMRGASAHAR
ncbi:hypothetical protein Ari01nite_46000 [Paractinoplanes rishiriensis]|uniref:Uncharacterized protein n=1 Tax=Paractinoplanes rishiriensis TaxID=1050105 RepID=A0A919K147_9ACTN|nr:hypothetical protein Ari01nite_46000 [Actinoplanes rishiriensis]